MVFWLSAACLVAITLFYLLRSLGRPPVAPASAADDLAFYRSQQDEIARQRELGMMTEADASAAEAEAARRLLARTRQADNDGAETTPSRNLAAQVLVTLAIPALALPLYLALGAPNAPSMPHASRTDIDRSEQELTRLIERLDAHLLESPEDVRGNEMAFPVYMRLGRFADAAIVAERLLKLQGESADRLTAFAEARVFADRGIVTPPARAALDRALQLQPDAPRATFYTALAVEQGGDPDRALAMWRALAARLPDGAEKRAVAAQIDRVAGTAGPEGAAGDAVRQLPPEERQNAIRSMVAGLEQRLLTNGGTPDEWQRLLRALSVLGEQARAASALDQARRQFGGDPQVMGVLTALARELALGQEAKP